MAKSTISKKSPCETLSGDRLAGSCFLPIVLKFLPPQKGGKGANTFLIEMFSYFLDQEK